MNVRDILRVGHLSSRKALGILACMLFVSAGGAAIDAYLLSPHRELRAAVTHAEDRLRDERRLLADAEVIHARYLEIESRGGDAPSEVMTESAVIGRVAGLAGATVHVKSVAPRRHVDGRTLHLAVDLEGPFGEVVEYLELLLEQGPSRITRLSLAADPRIDGQVTGRLSIEVVGLER